MRSVSTGDWIVATGGSKVHNLQPGHDRVGQEATG
jgi:hypothetical protein